LVRSQLRFAAGASVLAAGLLLGGFGSAVAVAAPSHSGRHSEGADRPGQGRGPHGNPSERSLRNHGVAAGSPQRDASGPAGGAVPASQAIPGSSHPQALVASPPAANAIQSQSTPASAAQFGGAGSQGSQFGGAGSQGSQSGGAGSQGSQSGGAEVIGVATARPAGGLVTAQQSSGQSPVSGLVQPPAVDAAAAPAAQPSAAVMNPPPGRNWADELGLPRVELPTLPGWLPAPDSASTDLDFGITGMLIMSAAGVAIGYRQARASRATGGHRTTR
jgi:hypothetical protein